MSCKLLKDKSKLVVQTWGKHGWIKHPVKDSKKYLRKTSNTRDEIDWKNTRGEMDLIQDVHNEIMYGPIGLEVDKLPGPLKDIFQQPSTWHITNARLFKILDEETQLQSNGDWGTDKDDADLDTFQETTTTSRLFLEQAGILTPDASTEEVTDILGAITDNTKIPDSPYGQRLSVDIQHISITPNSTILDDENSIDSDEVENISSTENDVIVYQTKDKIALPLPQLPKEAIDRIHIIREEFTKLFSKAKSDYEQEFLKLQYEQALDREINRYLTYSLNSPYCGHRYTPPQRVYQFIATPKESDISQAAEERVKFFYELFSEVAACDSMNDLHGKLVTDTRTRIDKLPNPNYGQKHRPSGFMGKIRGMYQHDKELAQEWSIYNRVDKDGNIIQKSSFNLAREEFIQQWREDQKGDEETLRIAVWIWFDREAKRVEATYDEATSVLVSSSHRYKDSIWRQKRTKALQYLFLTKKQWDAIYVMVGVIKKRLRLYKESTQERIDVLDQLAKHFRRITNLNDLNSYVKWAKHRTIIKNGKIHLARTDKISFLDETKWLRSCAKKRRYLVGRVMLFNSLREQVKSSKPTNLEEQFLCCPDPACNCMAIGQPEWFEIEKDKGLLGIKCDGCEKIVWCLEHKETPILRTYKEVNK